MNSSLALLTLPLLVALALGALLWCAAAADRRGRHRTGLRAANIAEGTRESDSLIPDVTIPARYLLAKRGSDPAHFTLAGAGDRPMGVCADQSSTAGVPLPGLPLRVDLFGCGARTKKVAINSPVNQDDLLVADAGGYAKTLPAASGTATTYWVIGSAQQAGAASGVAATPTVIEFIACLPYQLTH